MEELENPVMENTEMEQPETTVLEQGASRPQSWSAFVEGDVANFFTGFKLEKMTIEDGNGNKAKLARTKEGAIKVDYTTSVTI